jgi:BolA protein
MDRRKFIEDKLREALQPLHLEIRDDSAKHAGHAGAASGGGHFDVLIVAAAFRERSRLQRQRAVYAALGGTVGREIHALVMTTLTPEEWQAS